jgi:hypothetical protein
MDIPPTLPPPPTGTVQVLGLQTGGAGGSNQAGLQGQPQPQGSYLAGVITSSDPQGKVTLTTPKGDVSLRTDTPLLEAGSRVTLRMEASADGTARAQIVSVDGQPLESWIAAKKATLMAATPAPRPTLPTDILTTSRETPGTPVPQSAFTPYTRPVMGPNRPYGMVVPGATHAVPPQAVTTPNMLLQPGALVRAMVMATPVPASIRQFLMPESVARAELPLLSPQTPELFRVVSVQPPTIATQMALASTDTLALPGQTPALPPATTPPPAMQEGEILPPPPAVVEGRPTSLPPAATPTAPTPALSATPTATSADATPKPPVTVPALVLNTEPKTGMVTLATPTAMLTLPVQQLPEIGSHITLMPIPRPAGAPLPEGALPVPEAAPPAPSAVVTSTQAVRGMERLVGEALTPPGAPPPAPATVTNMLGALFPKADMDFPAGLAFASLALRRAGGAKSLIGKELLARIEQRGMGEMLERVLTDFPLPRSVMPERSESAAPPTQWQMLTLPVFDGTQLQPLRMYWQQEGGGQQESRGEAGPAFRIELELSRLGPMQFDGKVRQFQEAKLLDFTIRSTQALSEKLEDDIATIFYRSLEGSSLQGQIRFDVVEDMDRWKVG